MKRREVTGGVAVDFGLKASLSDQAGWPNYNTQATVFWEDYTVKHRG
jgi:hypothetical protein